MSKVLIEVTIKNVSDVINFKTKGILNENTNILIYNDGKSKNILDINNNVLKRETDDAIITFEFIKNNKTKSTIFIKETKTNIFVEINTIDIYKTSEIFKVIYIVEEKEKIEYEIKY